MTKAKTNALDALRSLIAERQQYEQWISSLDSRREGTPEHVFERVKSDYQSRLERVVSDIRGHAEELQLSISTLSARLVEVAREEDTRREGLQEAELRAAVGEYEPEQWDQLRSEAEKALEKIAADRASLDGQLGELRGIQKLSEIGSVAGAPEVSQDASPTRVAPAAEATSVPPAPQSAAEPRRERPVEKAPPAPERRAEDLAKQSESVRPAPEPPSPLPAVSVRPGGIGKQPTPARPRQGAPAAGLPPARARSEIAKPDTSKSLKCPECGTPNYPTEWYCERCGGELATM